jgi:A/G-specific adenine glycosylase
MHEAPRNRKTRLNGAAGPAECHLPDAAWKGLFRRRLLAWFALHQRELPWRQNRDPYRVWISEIMLQQTQVVTVVPYFERFLSTFPTVEALAAAPESAVLHLWEGLGYYRRARQLHRAAKEIVAEYAGSFPRDLAAIGLLPGIGRYTAGAIASIAYDLPAPILEANTVRLLSRLLAFDGDPSGTAGQRFLWQAAEALLPRLQAGAFNQALMELGSLLCTPKEPACDTCPVASLCRARLAGRQHELPLRRAKQPITPVREVSVAIWRDGKIFLRQRPEGERWAGLWDYPRFTQQAESPLKATADLIAQTRELTGFTIAPGRLITTIVHGVTRFRITLECYAAQYIAGRLKKQLEGHGRWLRPAELADVPQSTTGRKLSRILLSEAAS